jgi:hypothetical protein
VYQVFLEELGNLRIPKIVELMTIARRLRISYKAALVAKQALVKKGLLEQWTTTFRDEHGFFRRATYYRLRF